MHHTWCFTWYYLVFHLVLPGISSGISPGITWYFKGEHFQVSNSSIRIKHLSHTPFGGTGRKKNSLKSILSGSLICKLFHPLHSHLRKELTNGNESSADEDDAGEETDLDVAREIR